MKQKIFSRFLPIFILLILTMSVRYLLFARMPNLPSTSTNLPIQNSVIDPLIQKKSQDTLLKHIHRTKAKAGMVVVMDAQSGDLNAVTDYTKGKLGSSSIVVTGYEPGSVMKPLMLAAALNEHRVTRDSTYYEPGSLQLNHKTIVNHISVGRQVLNTDDIITMSLNTGAVHLLETLGQNNIDQKAMNTWYRYLTQQFLFGTSTSSNLAGEETGYVRKPSFGPDIQYQYATSSFGIGIAVTPLQLITAYASIVNGGINYQPRLVNSTPQVIRARNVVTPDTGKQVTELLVKTYRSNNIGETPDGTEVGGKSGTAPSYEESGIYSPTKDIGTYIGFVKTQERQYIIFTRLDEPVSKELASREASKVWVDIMHAVMQR